jgi:uncharacterized protein
VTGFAGTRFKVDGQPVEGGILLTAEGWHAWDGRLDADALAPALSAEPEFLILGTGATLVRPPRDFAAALEARGIGLEAMDSRAAARAWGMLRSEGRWIAAALMPVG